MPTPLPRSRTLMADMIPMLFCSVLIVSAQERPSAGSEAKPQPSRQEPDQPAPVDIAPEPTDPTELAIRTIRRRPHNSTLPSRNPNCIPATTNRAKKDGCVAFPTLEELPESVPSKVTIVDLPPFRTGSMQSELPAPVNWSDTIIVGIVKRIQPYLSEDKRSIYTEHTISVIANC